MRRAIKSALSDLRAGPRSQRGAPAPRLIFLHLPKTAGSTLRRIIEKYYGRRTVFTIGEPTAADIDRLMSLPRNELDKIRAIVGHLPFGLHALLPWPSAYVTLLREPVDRIVSHYYYAARTPDSPLFPQVDATGRSLRRYVEEAPASAWFNNGQTRLLGSADPYQAAVADRATLERAKARLADFAVVGLAERFDESLARIASHFCWPSVRTYQREKVSGDRVPLSAIPAADRDLIAARNALDAELYAFARERFTGAAQPPGSEPPRVPRR
jgi:hypothetical protein